MHKFKPAVGSLLVLSPLHQHLHYHLCMITQVPCVPQGRSWNRLKTAINQPEFA